MKNDTIGYLISSIICLLGTLLIVYKIIHQPNRLRIFLLTYALFTLPASIINTITSEEVISQRCNSILYLVATFLMLLSFMYMLTDLGVRLRSDETNWKHPLVLASVFFLLSALAILISQIVVLCRRPDWDYPLKSTFIASVIISIVSVSCIFTYTFMPLIYWKESRKTVGYSRTTALGIWFFTLQSIWFGVYIALYIWFFIADNWEYWQILLAFDYSLRYLQNIIYSWPPPTRIIDFLTDQLITTVIQVGNNRDIYNVNIVMNSETYTKDGDTQMLQTLSKSGRSEFINGNSDSPYGSKTTIIDKDAYRIYS